MSRDHHTFRYDGRREEARRPVGGRHLGGSRHPGGRSSGSTGPKTARPTRRTWRGQLEALGVRVTQDGEVLRLSSVPSSRMKIIGFNAWNEPGWHWHVRVGRDDMLPGLSITAESGITRVKKLVVGEDVLTGDADFDAAAHIKGDAAYLLARMSPSIRKALRGLLDDGGRVEDGFVWWSRAMDAERPDDLPAVVRRLINIARRLGGKVDIDARLRKHMVGDPDAGHRRRCLDVLLGRGDRLDGREGRRLLSDADHGIRLTAARVRQDVPTLVALAGDDEAAPAIRAAAVHSLGTSDDPAAVVGIDGAAGVVASAAVAALERWFERDPAIVERLGEAALLLLLDDGPRAAQGPVIDRLGEVGTEAAVPALVSIADAFFGRRALKDRARAASGRITERQGGLRAGGLSVAEAPEGGLTMAGGGGDDSR